MDWTNINQVIQTILRITFTALAALVVEGMLLLDPVAGWTANYGLGPREPPSHSLRLTTISRLETSSPSCVKPNSRSRPSWLTWVVVVVSGAEIVDMAAVVAEAAAEAEVGSTMPLPMAVDADGLMQGGTLTVRHLVAAASKVLL